MPIYVVGYLEVHEGECLIEAESLEQAKHRVVDVIGSTEDESVGWLPHRLESLQDHASINESIRYVREASAEDTALARADVVDFARQKFGLPA